MGMAELGTEESWWMSACAIVVPSGVSHVIREQSYNEHWQLAPVVRGSSTSARATARSRLSSHISMYSIQQRSVSFHYNVHIFVDSWGLRSRKSFSTSVFVHIFLLTSNYIIPQSMPDRGDGTAAAGTIKNERTRKRSSVVMETGTPDVDSGSKTSHTSASPSASGTTAKEGSPKRRRKVNHGQNYNSWALSM